MCNAPLARALIPFKKVYRVQYYSGAPVRTGLKLMWRKTETCFS
jgi:hypothetical protein